MTAEDIAKTLKNAKRTQNGWEACCPCHDDRSASLTLADGKKGVVFHCHAGCSQDVLFAHFKPMLPAPEREPRAAKPKIVKTYDYYDHETGELKMQVCRMEPKTFRQRRPNPDKPGDWLWAVPEQYRTLYNAPRVAAHQKTVLIVEGEKDVDNLAELGFVATCNPGGAGKWDERYNAILRGKDVVLVPDNDEPGEAHARAVGAGLLGVASRIRICRLPGLPPKGDVSDWIAAGGDRAALIKIANATPDLEPPQQDEPGGSGIQHDNDNTPEAIAPRHRKLPAGCPFRALGFNNGNFYYIGAGSQQVTELTAPSHTLNNMLTLASLSWWERNFPAPEKSKSPFNVVVAADSMIDACHDRGIFIETAKRGRGAWWDDGRVVVHCGDMLYVDRQPEALARLRSRYVYEQGAVMPINIDNPLTVDEAHQYYDLTTLLPFERPSSALLLSGWVVCSHICGALNWRPHIWLTGDAGSGKSWIMKMFVKPMMEDGCLPVNSATTAAGLRQSLGSDSIPVLFDEAESTDDGSNRRIQDVLELARQSSSESGTAIVKGSQGGVAKSYLVRSCFMFASINASLQQDSDKSRITLLEIKKAKQVHPLPVITDRARFLGSEYTRRWVARSVSMIPVIRQNATTFATVIAELVGEQRAGDQMGALLAGAYSLHSDDVIDCAAAASWVSQWDWSWLNDSVKEQSAGQGLIQHIIQSRIEINIEDKAKRMTVAEAIELATTDRGNPVNQQLMAYGIKLISARVNVADDYSPAKIFVANDILGIKKLLKDTRWASADYGKILARQHPSGKLLSKEWMGPLGPKRGVYVEIID